MKQYKMSDDIERLIYSNIILEGVTIILFKDLLVKLHAKLPTFFFILKIECIDTKILG